MKKSKIGYLDGIRGVAAFVVVLNHIVALFYPGFYGGMIHTTNSLKTILRNSPFYVLVNGHFAVCLFFILSGFVLSYKFFKTWDKEIIRESVIKRYFRLVIPVVFSIFLAFILMKSGLFYNQQAALITESNWGAFWNFEPEFFKMLKIAFVDTFINYEPGTYNMVLWTMTHEFFGSLVVFAILFIVSDFNKKQRFIFYIIAIIYYRQAYTSGFIVGMMMCDYYCNVASWKLLKNEVLNWALFLSGLLIGSYYLKIDAVLQLGFVDLEKSYFLIGGTMMIFALLNSNILQKAFSVKPILWLGNISFSMYIIHLLIFGTFTCYVFTKVYGIFNYNMAFLVTIIPSLIIMFIASHYIYKYLDMGGVKLSKSVYNKLSKKE